jgi:N-acetylmuramoyl-L-alanine amidase
MRTAAPLVCFTPRLGYETARTEAAGQGGLMKRMRMSALLARAVMARVGFILLLGFAVSSNSQAQSPRAAKPPLPKCDRAAFRVVVDVGHTAETPGATSARGVSEYEFNLRLAKTIERKLLDAGFARTVLLITSDPVGRGLFQRVRHANQLPADLFLSIHHDSVPTWLLEKWEHDGQERRFSDRFRGHSIFISSANPEFKRSLLFAKLLGQQLAKRGLTYTPHYTEEIMGPRRRELLDREAGVYRYDQLIVLRETQMPAVLLEAGSIINRDEELVMATPERQSLIGAAVVDAVETYCAQHKR